MTGLHEMVRTEDAPVRQYLQHQHEHRHQVQEVADELKNIHCLNYT